MRRWFSNPEKKLPKKRLEAEATEANWETLTLIEAPGKIRHHDYGFFIPSPFVVGIQPAMGKPMYIPNIRSFNGLLSTVPVELPAPKVERLCSLFRRLYATRWRPPAYDCYVALSYIEGAIDTIKPLRREFTFYDHTTDPRQLRAGDPYLITEPLNTCEDYMDMEVHHAALAVDETHVLHVAGNRGGLAHTPMTDVLHAWSGEILHINKMYDTTGKKRC